MSDQKDNKGFETVNDQTVTIDGVDYAVSDLSDQAKVQYVNLRVTDEEINRLRQRMAIAQTARKSYADALLAALPPGAADVAAEKAEQAKAAREAQN
jgi:hypothetical protein